MRSGIIESGENYSETNRRQTLLRVPIRSTDSGSGRRSGTILGFPWTGSHIQNMSPYNRFSSKLKFTTNGSGDEVSRALVAFAFGAVRIATFGKDRQHPGDGAGGRGGGGFSFALRRT